MVTTGEFLFHPTVGLQQTPDAEGAAFDDFTVTTVDGEIIHGWWIPHPQARGSVIFCHGNAGAIDLRLDYVRLYQRLRMNLVLWDYRGYGRSTGEPSELGMYRDVEAVWLHAQQAWGLNRETTLLHGRSMGGGVASYLASKERFAGMILEATFSSATDSARERYPWLPVDMLLRHTFPTWERLQTGDEPLLIMHSRDDEAIPYHQAEKNFAAAVVDDKQLLPYWGEHNYAVSVDDPRYFQPIDEVIARWVDER